MLTDHSSAGFEYLLRDRPIVRIHCPELIQQALIHPDYVALLASASRSVAGIEGVTAAVECALADPGREQDERRRVAAELFYKPGGATARTVRELYEVLELSPSRAVMEGVHWPSGPGSLVQPDSADRWQCSA